MKKLYILALMTVCIFGTSMFGIRALANDDVETQIEAMAEYIDHHFTEFKKAYNSANDTPLTASRVDSFGLVYILDAGEVGIYLDFDGENGYLVSTLSYELYAVETTGDASCLNDMDVTLYYSILDGFLYHDGVSYQKCGSTEVHNDSVVMYGYAGQYGSGEARIYNINDYTADRYPSYTLEEEHRKAAFAYTVGYRTMRDLSIYVHFISLDGGINYGITYENNCALYTVYNVVTSWGEVGYMSGIPSRLSYKEDFSENITRDPLYQQYGTGSGGIGIDSYWELNNESYLERIPQVYYWTRYYAIQNGYYNPGQGMTTASAINLFPMITNHYGSTRYVNKTTNFADVLPALDKGYAVFMGIANSQSFGEAHAVAAFGYKKYSKTTGVWIFQQKHTAYFFMIDDGYYATTDYFDLTCNSKVSYEFLYYNA